MTLSLQCTHLASCWTVPWSVMRQAQHTPWLTYAHLYRTYYQSTSLPIVHIQVADLPIQHQSLTELVFKIHKAKIAF